ncbi:glutathione S-transferase N-terminal domain-containing protein [Sphingobium sp. YBL2]|uniref:glutathione S-transferase N-terminal domain-containing protein n=1 Tax=Sphingobium sp. (strain YBL2) TaxID=484429 RepID=UPI003FD2F1D0
MPAPVSRARLSGDQPAGDLPFLIVDGAAMSESSAITQYLADTHSEAGLSVAPSDPAYADYPNFLHMGEATLTVPQTLYFRYTMLEPSERPMPKWRRIIGAGS